MTSPSPFIKWAGGKRRLLPTLLAASPIKRGRYVEPFIGGGAMFFAQDPVDGAILCDVNPHLVSTYRTVRSAPLALCEALEGLATTTAKEDFYRIREEFNVHKDVEYSATSLSFHVEQAARFIYLNKVGFNGMYRENSKGEYNIPWGQRKQPTLFDKSLIEADAKHLQDVTILQGSIFSILSSYCDLGPSGTILDALKPGDFVYLDPPYIPLNPTSSFSKYSRDDFTEPDQRLLAKAIQGLTKHGVRVLLSNSDTPLTRDIFSALNLYAIRAPRSISARAESRGSVSEILAVNYDPAEMLDSSVLNGLRV